LALWASSHSSGKGVDAAVRPAGLIECRFLSPARHPVEFIAQFIDIILHLDAHLQEWVRLYDVWIYAILFFVIFAETGFVVTPFLPGDSLLFVAGALAALGTAEAQGGMHLGWLLTAVSVAAVTGNMVNYQIGRLLGPKVFQWEKSRLFNREALLKTQAFYERHGGKTLVISRFLPIFRTFAPFVAGIGAMNYGRFFLFNLSGGLGWCFSLTLAGYWFGNLLWVRQNLSLLIVGIILVSLLPMLIAYLMRDKSAKT
jgi:membrane-associated protein